MFVRFSIFLSISLVAPLSSGASCDISVVRKSCPSGTFSSAADYSVPHSTQKQRPLSGKKELQTFEGSSDVGGRPTALSTRPNAPSNHPPQPPALVVEYEPNNYL